MTWQTVIQPAIHHQVQSAIRQEKTQLEEFVQPMRVNEDLFPSCMAKVDNENKCVESEKLNFRMTNKSGDMNYKVQNLVNKFKDEERCGEEHSFEKPHEEEAPAIEKEEAKIGLIEWVKNKSRPLAHTSKKNMRGLDQWKLLCLMAACQEWPIFYS